MEKNNLIAKFLNKEITSLEASNAKFPSPSVLEEDTPIQLNPFGPNGKAFFAETSHDKPSHRKVFDSESSHDKPEEFFHNYSKQLDVENSIERLQEKKSGKDGP